MDFASLRHQMVARQLRGRDITDHRVLAVMEELPRHLFVPDRQQKRAYDDEPVLIGMGQTMSQPYMVAKMTTLLALRGTETVLEIGTGSGYQAAVLGLLAAQVWTVERHEELAVGAERILADLGIDNVRVIIGDGTLGLPEAAPFDAIVVTAAAPAVPAALREQLASGGRMVIPTASTTGQELLLLEKVPLADPGREGAADLAEGLGAQCRFRETSILGCVFVPLIGRQGYPE